MQGKGAIRFLAVILVLVCVFELSFTLVTYRVGEKAAAYATDASGNFDPAKESAYLDSMAAEVVYNLGFAKYTYKECKEKEINLGLDLKGGMNVMLEVSVPDIVTGMANSSSDEIFKKAMELARANQQAASDDFIGLFAKAFKEVAPGDKLNRVFGTYELRDKINANTSDEDVMKVLRGQVDAAVANSYNVLRSRIDRFGVTQPNLQRLGNSGRILVELPGVKEPERVRKLLQGTANLEFWETYENAELFGALSEANNKIREIEEQSAPKPEAKTDSKKVEPEKTDSDDNIADLLSQLDSKADSSAASEEELNFAKQNPLFHLLMPSVDQSNGQPAPGARVGIAHYRDTSKIRRWLQMPQIRSLFPRDVEFMWSIKAIDKGNTYYELIAIKNTRDGKPRLDGSAVVDAHKGFSGTDAYADVSMSMNSEGAKVWARLTADNIGKCVAIVLDGYVYSYPRVNQEIKGGQSSITGTFSPEEADDLANVLKSGKLPTPARIIQEAVVGPSLGQASINAGMMSFVLAFCCVLIYMFIFYNGAGLVANIALLTNLLLLFGVLASLRAVLTLPGICGIVLTMGMAVDANVIIYERIKEELKAGKGVRLAISDGFKNAYSAIIDGNVTTMITGVMLLLFGSGPVQGFATTLIIGILTSLFSAIFISRLIFLALLDKEKKISFSNKYTENFLSNVHINFIGLRKYAYVFSIVITVLGCISLGVRGLSYGVDFAGGRSYVVRFDQKVAAEDVRASMREHIEVEKGASVEVKTYGQGGNQLKITTDYMIKDQSQRVDSIVDELLYAATKEFFASDISFPEFISTMVNPNGIIQSEKVGPTVADDIKRDAVVALVLAVLAMFLYIAVRFKKWQWGFGAAVSQAHDALIVIFLFSVFSGIMPFTLDIDQSFIAALLTIIGYSINDTVIIFDRIRENIHNHPKVELGSNINNAINSVLARTVNTGFTTLIVLIAIFLLGGEAIQGFTFALIVGIVFGTYSSNFVATPVAYELLKRKQKKEAALAKK
ncbi:MAG: protein translocase subunit SecDF [Prevotellaceae bacterium]|jgi:SecD/SecF fusion protein|nr:protein translocase subunit SecDF [Prevotellaceae bacterium]